jgi:hypothetical protein
MSTGRQSPNVSSAARRSDLCCTPHGALEEPSWHVARYMADAFGSITLLSPHALRSATDVLRRSDV